MSVDLPLTKGPPDSSSVNGSEHEHECSSSAQGADSSLRERVVKELGITSSAFIGPAFPPEKTAVPKPDFEDKVSEFYKELEEMGAAHDIVDVGEEQVSAVVQQKTPPLHNTDSDLVSGTKMKSEEVDGYRDRVQHRQASRPHWYQNEPYKTRRPRAGVDCEQQWQYPPEPGPHTPLLQHSALPHLASNSSQGFSQQSLQQQFSTIPPPDVCRENVSRHQYTQYSKTDKWGFDQHSDQRNPDWNWNTSRDLSQPSCVWKQRYESEHDRWERQHHSRPPEDLHTLILMRGLPGSGKSTLARELLQSKPSGVILSTDDYFAHKHGYSYDRNLIGEAHEWNQRRAEDSMRDGCSPIIIDNTNTEAWEMKPYVKMALEQGYRVEFCEPDTRWKFDPSELERRNTHRVPREKICHMLRRFSAPISINLVLNSEEPPHVRGQKTPGPPHRGDRGPSELPHRGPSGAPHRGDRGPSELPHRGPSGAPHRGDRGCSGPAHQGPSEVPHRGPLDRGPSEPPH